VQLTVNGEWQLGDPGRPRSRGRCEAGGAGVKRSCGAG